MPHTAPPAAAQAAPKPKPAAPPVDLSLGNGYEMRHPVHDGRLTVIPIVAPAPSSAPPAYITLHDGMMQHLVSVKELAHWEVDKVRIKNKSDQPLFAMSGQLIVDALQDRVLAEDVVIPPHTTLQVSVRCVEQNRERGGSVFHSVNVLAELDLRELVVHSGQTQVWAQVDAINARLGLSPPTKTYRLAAELQPASRRDGLLQALQQMPDHDRVVGLAVAIDGKLVAFERFASPALYQQLERELLGSYVASDSGPPHEGRALLPADVRAVATLKRGFVTTDASAVFLLPST